MWSLNLSTYLANCGAHGWITSKIESKELRRIVGGVIVTPIGSEFMSPL